MKRIIALIVALLLSSQAFSQEKEVVYGTVRNDGYQNIEKGAFWSSRPEAKLIYEGQYPVGYNVFVLEKDYIGRFVDTEHNNLDRNYIIFPKNERLYTDSAGFFYSSKCGNRLEYLRPVDMVIVKEVIVRDTVRIPVSTNIYNITNNNFFGTEPQPKPQLVLYKISAWDRWLGKTLKWTGAAVGTIGLGYGIYELCRPHGKPAPAPITPERGPGKAPIIKGQKELSISFSFRL